MIIWVVNVSHQGGSRDHMQLLHLIIKFSIIIQQMCCMHYSELLAFDGYSAILTVQVLVHAPHY